ncbi:Cytochrome c oxidase subunit IV [Fragilaria crotonensis]|nr:Cytochrome c oxidase subunit IV [Fragilaria crotonensis]
MVKVWYTPPPYGPRTSLDRPAYGLAGGNTPQWIVRLSKLPKWQSIGGSLSLFCVLAYLPLIKTKLPYTMSPEYIAAQRAYMRYHNMNPIYGLSSKKARAADP